MGIGRKNEEQNAASGNPGRSAGQTVASLWLIRKLKATWMSPQAGSLGKRQLKSHRTHRVCGLLERIKEGGIASGVVGTQTAPDGAKPEAPRAGTSQNGTLAHTLLLLHKLLSLISPPATLAVVTAISPPRYDLRHCSYSPASSWLCSHQFSQRRRGCNTQR